MKKSITLMIIVLLASLPIYSSLAFATFNNLEITGSDEIDGFIKPTDPIFFEVEVEGVDDLSPEDLVLHSFKFDECRTSVDSHICSLTYEHAYAFDALPMGITISRYDPGNPFPYGTPLESISGTVVVDGLAPGSIFFDNCATFSNIDLVNVQYTLVEKSCNLPQCHDLCSGISKVEFYKEDVLLDTQEIDTDSCLYTGTFQYSTDVIDGSEEICLLPYDKLGQYPSEKVCKSFSIDRVAPEVDSVSLQVIDLDGNEIIYVSTYTTPAHVSVNIVADDIDKDNVYADFSELGGDVLKATCSETINSVTSCSWDVDILLSTEGIKSIPINASDIAGNINPMILQKEFIFDTTGPIVRSIMTFMNFDSINYAKSFGNIVVANIREDESGIVANDVKLHVKNPEDNTIVTYIADECSSGYNCVFNDVVMPVSEGFVSVYLGSDTQDLLGNPMVDTFDEIILIDSNLPQITDVKVSGIGATEGALPLLRAGDSIKVEVTVADDTGISDAFMDVSTFVQNADEVSGSCEKLGSGQFKCTFISPAITAQTYLNDILTIRIIDYAGNEVSHIENIESFAGDDTAVPDYWSFNLACSPSKIDRQITPLIETKIYCHVDLLSKQDNVEVVSLDLSQCSGDLDILVDHPELENAEFGSVDPYLVFELEANRYEQETFTLNCPLRITSKIGNEITINPEIEEIETTLPFYSSALGEFGEAVQDKVDDAKDGVLVSQEWIGSLNQLLHYGEKLCGLVGTIIKGYGVLSSIGTLLNIGEPTPANAASGGLITKARQTIQQTQQGVGFLGKEGWGGTINKFCKFFSCRLYYDDISWIGGTYDSEKGTNAGQGWADSIGDYQRSVFKGANWVSTGGGIAEKWGIGGDTEGNIQAWGDGSTGQEVHIQGGKLNPKDSIVMSVLTLCIPGIIYNLEKLRQIDCMYIDCLENMVPNGLPIQACEDSQHYSKCKYITGELFQLLPFTGLINHFIGLVKQALSSPFGVVDTVLAFVCEPKILGGPVSGKLASVCLLNDMLGLTADVFQDLKGIGEGWSIENDYCEGITFDDEDSSSSSPTVAQSSSGSTASSSSGDTTGTISDDLNRQ